jgi:hypothetical protein
MTTIETALTDDPLKISWQIDVDDSLLDENVLYACSSTHVMATCLLTEDSSYINATSCKQSIVDAGINI